MVLVGVRDHTHKFNWIANRRPYYHYYYNYIFMNDAKEGRNEGSLVETGVYITLINIFGPMCIFCSVSRVSS